MCSHRFQNNFLTIGHVRFRFENSFLAIKRVRFTSKIIFFMCLLCFKNNLLTIECVRFTSILKKSILSNLSIAFVSLSLPFLEGKLLYRGGDLSMEGETHLRRGRLV